MYNLLIVASNGSWDSAGYYLNETTRFLEYTEPQIRAEFRNLGDPATVTKLCSMPALFMYEKQFPAPGWLGRITNVRGDSSGVAVEFTVDRSRPYTWDELNDHLIALGIHSSFELNRTHWAIKNADVEGVLARLRPPLKAFISYKWESEEHLAWVRKFATGLRVRGIEAILDQWEVRFGGSFTDYMQTHIANADVVLFVITTGSIAAAEAPTGLGGSLKFEVQMMNARRSAEGTPIIGVYRSGDRPPHYLRDHRYIDFRDDSRFDAALDQLVNDLLGKSGPPPLYQK